MTTVAFDGRVMAADDQSQDGAGLLGKAQKIHVFEDCVVAGAGEFGQISRWIAAVRKEVGDNPALEYLLANGYPTYDRDKDPQSIMLVERKTKKIWTTASGWFIPVDRKFHAIGSGRDFALTAMHLKKGAITAVGIAGEFDVNTGFLGNVVRV